MSDRFRLDGRRLLVTGGGGEIGGAVVASAAARGAQVGVFDLQVPPALQTAAISAFVEGSVTDEAATKAACAQIARDMGGLDGLVLAAGRMTFKPLLEMSFEEWRNDLNVNLDGTFHTLRYSIPLLADHSTIVIVSSVTGHNGSKLSPSYAASKAALLGLSRSLVHELRPRGIRVNCVSPGPVDTAFARDHFDKLKTETNAIASVDQIADAVLFLTSDASSHVNGESLMMTGGYGFA